MLTNYIRIAWRIIRRNRLHTCISVFSLALGICGCIIVWLGASYEFSFDKFHSDRDRIFRVGNGGAAQKSADIIPPMPDVIRRTVPGVEAVTTFFNFRAPTAVQVPAAGSKRALEFPTDVEGQNRLGDFILADENWFSIFRYEWLAGDPAALRVPFSVVLTENKARQYFGALPPEKFIGRELVYLDSLHVRVAGIVRDWKANTDLPYTAFISFTTIDASFLKEKRHMDDWVWHEGVGKWYWPFCFIKLAKGTSPRQVEARLQTIGKQVVGSDSAHPFQARLQPLADVHFNTDYSNDGIRKAHLPTMYALMGIALFILALGVVNFVNLSTAQSIQRAKEIGVRKVLGSGRTSLMVQFLMETAVITVLAVVLAVLLVPPVMAYFPDIPIGVHFRVLDPGTLLFLAGITVITTLLAGFYPARVLAGYLPVLSLKGGGAQKGGEKWLMRKALIVFQFSISLIFIIVTMLMGSQIRYMLNTDYGFKTNAIVTVLVKQNFWDTSARIDVVKQRFEELPGLAEVIKEGSPPAGWGGWTMPVEYKSKQDIVLPIGMEFGDDRYIPFYQMRLVAGRNLRHTDTLAEWVINETATRALGFIRPADAVGKMLYFGRNAYPIVGVIADFHEGSFKDPITPAVIGHLPRWEGSLGIRLASSGRSPEAVKAVLRSMEKIYKEVYPNDPFNYVFLDKSIAQLYESEQKTASLVRSVMFLAIFISCMGLFGLALFTARRKSAEISIRKVLGATTTDIMALLNKGFVLLVLLALVISSPIAWWITDRWLRDFAYRAPTGWWVFPVAGAAAIVIALVTVSFQSIRAALANPVQHLRSE